MDSGLLVGAFFFLTAAVLVVPLAQRGGLGSVLGYLLAGVAIGPFGLQLVTQPENILHFAEFGVVMMLFLIGLELEPGQLWRLRRAILGLGGAQVAVTTLAIATVALALGLTWQAGVAVGMALALSSTATGLQVLKERNLLGSAAGQSAFSVLLFQDIAIVPMLAVLPLLAVATAAPVAEAAAMPGWSRALTMALAVAGIVLGGRYLLRPVFRYIAATRIREIFTAFALLLVVGIALLMQIIGLSAALGTFLAGVVLANSEYRLALESDIEPFKALLLGLFFISVGMSMDFAVLADQPLEIAALVLGLVAVKIVILMALARVFGLAGDQNLLFSVVLAQGGEFAFLLLQFGVAEGVLVPAQAEPLTVVVALSMALTPLLLLGWQRVTYTHDARTAPAREPDAVPHRGRPVIIIGYGRFGQIVGRFLAANGISAVVLDNNSDRIDVLRKFGAEVYYGDASRIDLLERAGGDTAKLIVVAIGDPDKTVETTRKVRERFPRAKVLARARNRTVAHDLMAAGAHVLRRETFDSALALGREALVQMGTPAKTARRRARLFAEHDERALRDSFDSRHDLDALVSMSRQWRAQLEEIFRSDTHAEMPDGVAPSTPEGRRETRADLKPD